MAPNILTFGRPDTTAIAAIREVASGLPVRTFIPDPESEDSLDNAHTVGEIDQVLTALKKILEDDDQRNRDELDDDCLVDLVVRAGTYRKDALHVVTRLRPERGTAGVIEFGARIQRLAERQYALWSDY